MEFTMGGLGSRYMIKETSSVEGLAAETAEARFSVWDEKHQCGYSEEYHAFILENRRKAAAMVPEGSEVYPNREWCLRFCWSKTEYRSDANGEVALVINGAMTCTINGTTFTRREAKRFVDIQNELGWIPTWEGEVRPALEAWAI